MTLFELEKMFPAMGSEDARRLGSVLHQAWREGYEVGVKAGAGTGYAEDAFSEENPYVAHHVFGWKPQKEQQ